jgi:hypothetical protein
MALVAHSIASRNLQQNCVHGGDSDIHLPLLFSRCRGHHIRKAYIAAPRSSMQHSKGQKALEAQSGGKECGIALSHDAPDAGPSCN